MRINWGTGIVIGMILFIGFILYLVITMSTDKKYSHDLVTEAYYEKEMAYQDEIDAETNMQGLSNAIVGAKTKDGWLIQFPDDIIPEEVVGTLFLYRPSNKQLDFDVPIELSGSNLLIPDERLLDGRWNITMEWEYEGKKYLYKKQIVY
ncbi:MAG: FixH family protein [Bacteroidetes bacterium]|nr:FixH family protein [Bacteroidota bacterium]